MKNYAGHRLSPWLAHLMVSRQETARPLLTPGEVMQLPSTDEIITFLSPGIGFCDIVVAKWVYDLSLQHGIGEVAWKTNEKLSNTWGPSYASPIPATLQVGLRPGWPSAQAYSEAIPTPGAQTRRSPRKSSGKSRCHMGMSRSCSRFLSVRVGRLSQMHQGERVQQ